MYVSAWDHIYQFDLQASNITPSRDTVAVYDGFEAPIGNTTYQTRFYLMQNTPNGKIYISCPGVNSRYLHVIDQLDSAGVACNVLQHHIELPAYNLLGLPNLPNFRLGALPGSPCDTLSPIAAFTYTDDMLQVTFEDQTSRNPSTWHWDFGDGTTDDVQHPVRNYTSPGQYEVCLIASNNIGSDTVCQSITLMTDNLFEVDKSIGLQVRPNPANDFLFLSFVTPQEEDYRLSLITPTGALMLQTDLPKGLSQHDIEVSHLLVGIYFYQIELDVRGMIASGKEVISR